MLFSLKNLAKSSSCYYRTKSLGLVSGIDSTSLPFSTASSSVATIPSKDIVVSFKQWFKSGHNLFLHQIFQILKATDDADRFRDSSYDVSFHHRADLALSHLDLRLTKALVLEVLRYGSEKEQDVLSCLKFFDWVGRQRSFRHTRATFNAIFKILSRATSTRFSTRENPPPSPPSLAPPLSAATSTHPAATQSPKPASTKSPTATAPSPSTTSPPKPSPSAGSFTF
ncbi:hypothetical protein ACLB2K_057043 [Fragaria x ananassa]